MSKFDDEADKIIARFNSKADAIIKRNNQLTRLVPMAMLLAVLMVLAMVGGATMAFINAIYKLADAEQQTVVDK